MSQKRVKQLRKLAANKEHYKALKRAWNSLSWLVRDKMFRDSKRPLRAPRTNDNTKVE